MNTYKTHFDYIPVDGAMLFTAILLPSDSGTFPTVITRSPYVDEYEDADEQTILEAYTKERAHLLQNGYAYVFQHCRGRGKSSGDCIPYVYEREDGLALLEYIRKQPFYNGELLLSGGSYTASVHYLTAPFADDIKGAIFQVQDTERYNICYRNGFFKKALHGNWYVGMYKAKSKMPKNFTPASFDMLPLSDFTKTVFGESAKDFDAVLKAPDPKDAFWNTRLGGCDACGVTDHAPFPMLLTTGFYDIYTGGVFDMWNAMSDDTKQRSALAVSPYNHGDTYDPNCSIAFENGHFTDHLGEGYDLLWFDYIRAKRDTPPLETGKVTYYRLFENKWTCDTFETPETTMTIPLGEETVTYTYDPANPPTFRGGLSCNFGGTVFQDPPHTRDDIISVYTPAFEEDTFVKGRMSAKLHVRSDCEDTCFYVRVSIQKEQGDYGLRDDITSLVFQLGDYTPQSDVELTFRFDEHAFLIQKGEKLRVDIASADHEHYVRHTNRKGLFSEQTDHTVAHNTVDLQRSVLILPIEN